MPKIRVTDRSYDAALGCNLPPATLDRVLGLSRP
jgi:hypothetical protein